MITRILFGMLFVLASCHSNDSSQNGNAYKNVKIQIGSPYGCMHEIQITDDGDGLFISGIQDKVYSRQLNVDSIYQKSKFNVSNKKDLNQINEYVTTLKRNMMIRGSEKNDAYRFLLFIDEESKIDIYGVSVEMNKLLDLLIKYLPESTDDPCEFFKYFKSE